MNTRPLSESDRNVVEAFLGRHRDTSMFLRRNIAAAGLEYHDRMFEANYFGAFAEGELVGVAAHCWNGMILVQAPSGLDSLIVDCARSSGRPMTGLSGPLSQVKRSLELLDLQAEPKAMASDEVLYGLDLNRLIVPLPLQTGEIVCRPPVPEEYALLREWRFAYDVESLGSAANETTRARSTKFLEAQLAEGNAWVAVHDGRPVSLSAFNAALPDIVQLGGIYTPPEHRARGFARAAVAGSLIAAQARGVGRAVLFTPNPYAAKSYEAVGFERIGDYGLVLLAEGRRFA